MFGRKQKTRNKFHLPTEEPKPEPAASAAAPLYSDALTTEVYAEDGVPEEAEGPAISALSAAKYRFITSEGHLAEKKPTRNWEIYYRDRNYAGGVGDPLLKVVEAGSRQEAEAKARVGEGADSISQVVAVNTNNSIIRHKTESAFAYPSPQPSTEPNPNPFRGKA
jgi:hypothetical protein